MKKTNEIAIRYMAGGIVAQVMFIVIAALLNFDRPKEIPTELLIIIVIAFFAGCIFGLFLEYLIHENAAGFVPLVIFGIIGLVLLFTLSSNAQGQLQIDGLNSMLIFLAISFMMTGAVALILPNSMKS